MFLLYTLVIVNLKYGKKGLKKIFFINIKKLFSAKELVNEKFRYAKCIHADGTNGEFQPHQSGGRIFSFDDNNILFSTGEYRTRVLAQNEKSVNGKIIKKPNTKEK